MRPPRKDLVNKSTHYTWQIYYHLVLAVKIRKVLLDGVIVTIIQETTKGIEERYPIEMEAFWMDRNHIHILCSAHPNLATSRVVQIFKSLTEEFFDVIRK